MKITISAFLIISLLVASFSKSLICAAYEGNKEFISKHLCENRDKPSMHCNGKCHVIKKLKEDESSGNLPFNIKNDTDIQLYSENRSDFDFKIFYSGEVVFPDLKFLNVLPVFNFFHPPQA